MIPNLRLDYIRGFSIISHYLYNGSIMSELKFEEGMARLEEIVKSLEKGDLSLDQAMSSFEEGVVLSKVCLKHLEDADRKVEILIQSHNGQKSAEPFNIPDLQE